MQLQFFKNISLLISEEWKEKFKKSMMRENH